MPALQCVSFYTLLTLAIDATSALAQIICRLSSQFSIGAVVYPKSIMTLCRMAKTFELRT